MVKPNLDLKAFAQSLQGVVDEETSNTELPVENQTVGVSMDATISEESESHSFPVMIESVSSRAELVSQLVKAVFSSFQLTSMDTESLGPFAHGIVPHGFTLQEYGTEEQCRYSFLIKDDVPVSLGSLVPLVERIRAELQTKASAEFPLTYQRNLEGAVVRSLVVTPAEIVEIMAGYPELLFAYRVAGRCVDDMRFVVKYRR